MINQCVDRCVRPHLRRLAQPLTLAMMCLLLAGCATAEGLNQLAELAMARGDTQEADRLLTRSEDKRPGYWRTQYLVGQLRLEQGRPYDAAVAFQRARASRKYGPEIARMLDLTAQAMFDQGPTAEPHLRSFLEDAVEQYGHARDYIRQGVYLRKLGDADNALLALQRAVVVAEPDDPAPYLALADFHEQVGDSAAAVKNLRHAYYFLPDDPGVSERLRRHGVVPGPTAALPPQPR